MDKEQALELAEIIKNIHTILKRVKDEPLLVTQEDLDTLDYDLNLFNDLSRHIK